MPGESYTARQIRAGRRITHRLAVMSIGAALMPVVAVLVLGAMTIRWLNRNGEIHDVDQSEDVVE